MKIGIIGAGNIGGNLAERLVGLGHDVVIANSRGPETLGDVAQRTGADPVAVGEAGRGRDAVVITIPQARVPDLPAGLIPQDGGAAATTVIDTGNYYPRQRDGAILAIEDGLAESAWVENQIEHPVVKAFNNIYAKHLLTAGRTAGTPGRIALPVAGDERRGKALVMRLVDELGFTAVDAGDIQESWRQQPGTPVYATDLDADGVRDALAQASPQRSEEWRATAGSPGSSDQPR